MNYFSRIFVLAFLVSGFAFSQVQHKLSTVNSIQYDGVNLTVGSRIGGGCQKHHVEFEIELQSSDNKVTANVTAFDVSPEEDFCEAIVFTSGSINLKQAIAELLEEKGLRAWAVSVNLPQLEIYPQD